MGIVEGFVIWYHPARERDASCVTSPGRPFYTIQLVSKMVNGHYSCERRQTAAAEHTFPHTALGFKQCAAIVVEAALKSVEYYEDQLATTRDYRRRMLVWFHQIAPTRWDPFMHAAKKYDAKNKKQTSRYSCKPGAKS